MRKPAKAFDHIAVRLGITGKLLVTQGGNELNTGVLILKLFAVFIWKVDKDTPISCDILVPTSCNHDARYV